MLHEKINETNVLMYQRTVYKKLKKIILKMSLQIMYLVDNKILNTQYSLQIIFTEKQKKKKNQKKRTYV